MSGSAANQVEADLNPNQIVGNSRKERSGKGRRRRAAAEQRRIDEQRWGQLGSDEEEENRVAPRPVNRRRNRRNNRHGVALHLEDYYDDEPSSFNPNRYQAENSNYFDIEIAFAVSLSLASSEGSAGGLNYGSRGGIDMSYENLVQLENVKCVAPASIVSSLSVITFAANEGQEEVIEHAEVCAICQCEYENGDPIISLPCTHGFHHICGSEWLLNHSKMCPICKQDVTEPQ